MPALLTAAALAACAAAQAPAPSLAPPCDPVAVAWRAAATEADRRRLRDWRQAWTEALEQARAGGHAGDIAGEGALLEPDAALTEPAPPAGDYDCRTIKLGTPPGGLLTYVSYPAFRCRIGREGERTTFTKLSGSQRPIGRLYRDADRRLVFLGTLQLGDEDRSHQYGIDEERDMVGVVERIGERRWRLVLPYPHFESLLDVIELTPAAPR
jgi:hypothetical protein